MDTGGSNCASASSASGSISRLGTVTPENRDGELSMSQSDISVHKEFLWGQEKDPQVAVMSL